MALLAKCKKSFSETRSYSTSSSRWDISLPRVFMRMFLVNSSWGWTFAFVTCLASAYSDIDVYFSSGWFMYFRIMRKLSPKRLPKLSYFALISLRGTPRNIAIVLCAQIVHPFLNLVMTSRRLFNFSISSAFLSTSCWCLFLNISAISSLSIVRLKLVAYNCFLYSSKSLIFGSNLEMDSNKFP